MADELKSVYEQFEYIYSSIDCYVKPPDSPCFSNSDVDESIAFDEGFSESETDEPLHGYLEEELKSSPSAIEKSSPCRQRDVSSNGVCSEPNANNGQGSQFQFDKTNFQRHFSLNFTSRSEKKKEKEYTSEQNDTREKSENQNKHQELNEFHLSLSSIEKAQQNRQNAESPLKCSMKSLKISDRNDDNETVVGVSSHLRQQWSETKTETDLNKHSDESDHTFESCILQNNNKTKESDSNVIDSSFIFQTCEADTDGNSSLSDTFDCEMDSNSKTITASNIRSSVLSDTMSLPNCDTSFDEETNSMDKITTDSPFGKQLCYFRKKQNNDLFLVKNTTTRLGLKTRRCSYIKWRNENLDENGHPMLRRLSDTPKIDIGDKMDIFTKERVTAINMALKWIRNELEMMRDQDNSLAMQFIQIRRSIHELKLERSWEQHKEMLQEAEWEMYESENLKRVSDIPDYHLHDGIAKYHGLTPIKCGTRRFSIL